MRAEGTLMPRLPAICAILFSATTHILTSQSASETVTFKSGSLTLYGSIWKPAGAGPLPAVLYNHGSEKPVDYLAALGPVFTRRGYVLFVPERRGQGRSADQGPWISDVLAEERKTNGNDASVKMMIHLLETEHLDDQLAALAYLKSRRDVDPNRIAIAGCSFGGIQTLLAAERDTGARAGVDFAGAAITWERSPLHRRLTAGHLVSEAMPAVARRAYEHGGLACQEQIIDDTQRLALDLALIAEITALVL
jgi:carboxymethylenebutenolidase